MKKLFLFLSLFFICQVLYAQPGGPGPGPGGPGGYYQEITEEDAVPSTYPYKVKFTNGSVTDNGDATTSVDLAGAAQTATGWTDGGTDVYLTTTTDNVGIGTTVPVTKLEVNGVITCGGASAGQSIVASGLVVNEDGGATAADDFRAETDTEVNAFVVDASGNDIEMAVNVGIGTTAPLTPLHTYVSNALTTTPQLYIEQDSTGDASLELGIVGDSYIMGIDNSDNDMFKISYSSTQGGGILGTNDRLTINSSGAVDVVGGFTAGTVTSDGSVGGTNFSVSEGMKLTGFLQLTRDAQIIADGGVPATPTPYNLTPLGSFISLNCRDADGCDITMVEAGTITDGMIFHIVNISANACNWADIAGVQSVNGASITLGQVDMVSFMYTVNQYTQSTPVSNN